MKEVVIISGVRTAVGKFQGSLMPFSAPRLGALVVKEAVHRAGVEPAQVDECIMGCVLQAGLGQNPARQAALYGGLSKEVGALTVNMVCGSGLKSVALAAQAIQTENADLVVAGGIESMSNAPYLLPQARGGYRMGNGVLIDTMIQDGLWEVYNDIHMGVCAEKIATKYCISREEQDAFAVESHRRAAAAAANGAFTQEILPVALPLAKGEKEPRVFAVDESVRRGTTMEALLRLKPAFQEGGTVTAGNAPGVSDGAAAIVVTSTERSMAMGATPLAVIRAQATAGREPEWMGLAPIDAVHKVAERAGWSLDEVDLFELNEAFSVQALAVNRELGLDATRVNIYGGSVAMGHPIGASGTRVLVTLLYALAHKNKRKGIAALCLGGGNAVALAVERL